MRLAQTIELHGGGPGSGPNAPCDNCGPKGGGKGSADGRSGLGRKFAGYTHSRIGRYKIVEGIGPYGGKWAAIGRGETQVFNKREHAEQHAHLSEDADMKEWGHRMREAAERSGGG